MKEQKEESANAENLRIIQKYLPVVVIVALSYWVLRLDAKNDKLHEEKDAIQIRLIQQKASEADYLRHAYEKSTELYKLLLEQKKDER